jgi:monoamine oxidase
MSLTRRGLLERIAAIGGAAMAHEAMTALGLLAAPPANRFELSGGVSNIRSSSRHGIAGLTSPTHRQARLPAGSGSASEVGGRVLAVRRGTVSESGRRRRASSTRPLLQPGDADPASPPRHLDYCRELGVAIQALINQCDSVSLSAQDRGGPAPRSACERAGADRSRRLHRGAPVEHCRQQRSTRR